MGPDLPRSRPPADPGAALTAFLDLEDLFRRAVAYASQAAGTDETRILLHDSEVGEFVVTAASSHALDATRGQRLSDATGHAGAVLKAGQAGIGRARLATGRSTSVMAAPLKVSGRTIGIVEAFRSLERDEFTASDLDSFLKCCELIAVAVESASLYRQVDRDAEILKRSQHDSARPLIAESSAMLRVLDQAERAAAGRSTVVLTGETGTGKEQVARYIHEKSPRAAAPFVALNCGALPEGLIESELFGHEKGAFTSADRRHIGRFELADGGTLFLDEIGDLPAPAQAKLLRVLQEREISRVGGTQSIRVNVRLIAATHRDLTTEVREGRFREDLFFRIHVVPIHLPPLRERPDDVEPLTRFFLDRFAREMGRLPRRVSADAWASLRTHQWPGNVRELENLIERLLVLGGDAPIEATELKPLLPDVRPLPVRGMDAQPTPTIDDVSLWEQEHALLVQALERTGQNQTRAARLLKISREQLRTRMKRYGLLGRNGS
jgi:transcriptional regulator with GAF, ATPase, and Fis domain